MVTKLCFLTHSQIESRTWHIWHIFFLNILFSNIIKMVLDEHLLLTCKQIIFLRLLDVSWKNSSECSKRRLCCNTWKIRQFLIVACKTVNFEFFNFFGVDIIFGKSWISFSKIIKIYSISIDMSLLRFIAIRKIVKKTNNCFQMNEKKKF